MLSLGLFATQLQVLPWFPQNTVFGMPRTVDSLLSQGTTTTRKRLSIVRPSVRYRTQPPRPGPLGERNKFDQGSDLHFLHHPFAVGFHRACRHSQLSCDLFVHPAANNQFENLPFTRGQFPDTSANCVQFTLPATLHFVMRDGAFNCFKKPLR